MLPAQLFDRHASICLHQKPKNLFVGKPLLHVRSPFRKRTLLDHRGTVYWAHIIDERQADVEQLSYFALRLRAALAGLNHLPSQIL